MEIREGREAVWEHANECGIREDIARIAKHFDIKEINIFTPGGGGKLTYLNERPRKFHKIAVAAKPEKTLDQYLKDARGKK